MPPFSGAMTMYTGNLLGSFGKVGATSGNAMKSAARGKGGGDVPSSMGNAAKAASRGRGGK